MERRRRVGLHERLDGAKTGRGRAEIRRTNRSPRSSGRTSRRILPVVSVVILLQMYGRGGPGRVADSPVEAEGGELSACLRSVGEIAT